MKQSAKSKLKRLESSGPLSVPEMSDQQRINSLVMELKSPKIKVERRMEIAEAISRIAGRMKVY